MQLRQRTIADLADMIAGGPAPGYSEPINHPFPYRSGTEISKFFSYLERGYQHTGSRIPGTEAILGEMNSKESTDSALPSEDLVQVIRDLMDPRQFDRSGKDRDVALEALNKSLAHDGLEVFADETGSCQLRAGSVVSVQTPKERAWSHAELQNRTAWEGFLASASEDDFTEKALLPLLRASGFQGIQFAGHKDKALEYGKDLRMKFRLPTGHFIYFGIQVKKGKLDAAGRSKGSNDNVMEVFNQVSMALAHPVFDPEVNRKCLVDHVYVVATGEITKQARNLLVEKLDADKRRHLIFMDRDDLLDLLARRGLAVPSGDDDYGDDVPF